ncbi:MAG TPA: heavy metal translocating P-type ATPase [Candidatus Cloacimonadota bacterium]|nr:heavy metal translocating P-type ATPase [Candidatus Cloacimonadota bacterium]HQL14873.1 heavy metal translocating P-type ATPase [Candidatus Cloacimonadota bacterium]
MVIEEYELENLCCESCAQNIEEKIRNLPEVDSAHLDFLKKTLTVKTKTNRVLEAEIRKTVKNVEPDIQIRQVSQTVKQTHPPLPWPLLTAGLGVLVYVATYFSALPMQQKIIIYIIAYILSSWRVLFNALLKAFKGWFLDEHFLMSIASLGAVFLGSYPEAIAVMFLYEIGQFLENKAVDSSRNSILSLLKLKSDVVHRVIGDKTDEVPIGEIVRNESIVVLPGERIPLDGTVLEGQSALDTSALTGEALPQSVQTGDEVLAGTLNLSGRLVIKVTSIDAESTVTRIMHLVEDAAQKKSKTERFASQFAKIYTPIVVFLALIIAIIPPAVSFTPWSVWFKRALVFLIVSCPCALVISIPLTSYAAIGAAARKGILLKGSNFLDALARATTFVYDKTGTLTTGKLEVQQLVPLPEVSEERLAVAALTCEDSSTHPIAEAIKAKFAGQYTHPQVFMQEEFHGKGVKVQTANQVLYAGSRAFLHEEQIINLPPEPEDTCIFVAENGVCLGYITFRDEIKDDFPAVIKNLRKMGIRKHIMLTGDHAIQAEKVASKLGLTAFHARLLPADKMEQLEAIEQSQKSPVAFIGDGLNDAPVIARAEIGIAMGAIGNQAAIEAADVVLMQDEPHQLLNAVKMARRTRKIMWENIIFALAIKVAVMVLAIMGIATLWEAVLADVGVTLLAIGNSMRLVHK